MSILAGAIVVNPKTGEPFWLTISNKRGEYFSIRTLCGVREGVGYFETDESSEYYISAASSDYPRAHTPDGVVHEGVGNGTCLYVAGACAVFIANGVEGADDSSGSWPISTGVPYRKREDGISSTAKRSKEANAWWSRAVKLGLATEEEFSNSRTEEFDTCLESYDDALRVVDRFFSVEGSVQDASVCATGTTEIGGDVAGNILAYESATDRNLVAGVSFSPALWKSRPAPTETDKYAVRYTAEDMKPPKKWESFSLPVARAVNVGVFRDYPDPSAAFAVWTRICLMNGMSSSEYEEMNARFVDGIDVDPAVVMGIDDPRRNPSGRSTRRAYGGVRLYASSVRRNPAIKPTSQQIDRAMALAEERRRLGWDKLSNLP
jgi:hypothetical protein